MARRFGKLLLKFALNGLEWQVRVLPPKHKELDAGVTIGVCIFNERLIYIADGLTDERLRMAVAHEIQHAIEELCDVNHAEAAHDDGVSDRMTDLLARSWVHLIRANPELVAFLCATE